MRIGWTKDGKIFFSSDVKLKDKSSVVATLKWEPGYAEGVRECIARAIDGLKDYQKGEKDDDSTAINRGGIKTPRSCGSGG